MNPEIEIKLRVRQRGPLKKRLALLGFTETQARHFESNCLFDFADRRLRRTGRLIRLRHADGEGILTFKGPPLRTGPYKIREEIETRVEDATELAGILQGLGLQEVFRYEKYRTEYARRGRAFKDGARRDASKLLYDETPIGKFIELEGAESWIDETARQLGYRPRDYITRSYGRLYLDYCQAHGRKPGDMVFARRGGVPKSRRKR